ncbi:MAG TPA: PP2C family protein-serine/threonine phosphatase [Jatrophihabitans sp.]|nr:PP2C family protein-serine/threonine phosphatase [Jatrophihabitans sp.]
MTDPGPHDEPGDIDAEVSGRALIAANSSDPHRLLAALREQFLTWPDALDLSIHLIDYRLTSLRPMPLDHSPQLLRPEPVGDSLVGDAFRQERAVHRQAPAGHLLYVPITVRGQRLGVLTGTFARPPAHDTVRRLRSLAMALAYSILEVGAGTDIFETHRRHGRMSVAAEMQWQLLPARAFQTRRFYVAGHLEPALRVSGDAFDFAVDDDVMTLAVIDATTTGGAPSLLTTLAITALRNARRSGLSLAEQASLASDMLWQHTAGGEHAATLLMQLEADTGRAVVVDAGSPALLRVRDGRSEAQVLESQTPLGMFDGTVYAEEAVDMRPGDRAYLLTDGAFADGRTLQDIIDLLAVDEHGAGHTPPESIRRLTAALTRDGQEPENDITVVCVDWRAS